MATLALLPGLHGTGDLFGPLRAAIPPEIPVRVVAYPTDRLCNGAALMRSLEQQLENQTDLILLAESFSGPLAIQFACKYPKRVSALILCCTFIIEPVPWILCYLALPFIVMRFPLPNFLIRLFLAGSRAPRPLLRAASRAINRNSPLVVADRVRQAAHINVTQFLKDCPVPILCLAGSHDRLIGSRAFKRMQRARRDVPVKIMDAPHLLLQLKPEEVWREVALFLDSKGFYPAPNPFPAKRVAS